MKEELIEFAKMRLAMSRSLEKGQTKLSHSGSSVIFAAPACGRNDLSGRIELARAQMAAAGIDYQSIPPHECFSVSEEDWERLEADPKLLAYRIVKKGRKWLEGIHIFGETAIQIEINEASRDWEVGRTYVFAGETKKEASRYGTKVQIFPDCEASRQKRAVAARRGFLRLPYLADAHPAAQAQHQALARAAALPIRAVRPRRRHAR